MLCLQQTLLCGFPGETEQEFEETYQFLKEIHFYKMHIFPYSARRGTKAASMPNQTYAFQKEKRSRKLLELSKQYEMEFLEKEIGNTLEVLFEQEEGEWIKGHTSNYLEVKVLKTEAEENEIKAVKIEKREGLNLVGITL